jgi:hypothetical protein
MEYVITPETTTTPVGGMMFLIFAVPVAVLLVSLLIIAPLMLWLNLQRLRINLRDDLNALRESIDRLAGASKAVSGSSVSETAGRPSSKTAVLPVPQVTDKIGFSCPECDKFFEGPATLSGTTFTCPECNVAFHIH